MTPRVPDRIVIVGGGVAATRCAFELRACGYDREVVMLAAERDAPYDRTLLSKELLLGRVGHEDIVLRSASDYETHGVELRLGVRARALDTVNARVLLDAGAAVPYDRLVLATGGAPARPAMFRDPGALVLRELDDARELMTALARGGPVAIVGGGFVGAEVAAAACEIGLEVVLIEALDAPLARVLGSDVGTRVAELHRAHGVEVLTGAPVVSLSCGRVGAELRLSDGRTVSAASVLVGTGMVAATEWLEGSGLQLDNGVLTDALCRTNVPDVFAAGDCARWTNPRYGALMRAEHWDTAARHGVAVAHAALGDGQPFAPIPFFWSMQHGVRMQLVGRPEMADAVELEDRGSASCFVARYTRDDRLVAVFAAGQPRAVAEARLELREAAEVIV